MLCLSTHPLNEGEREACVPGARKGKGGVARVQSEGSVEEYFALPALPTRLELWRALSDSPFSLSLLEPDTQAGEHVATYFPFALV